MAVTPATAKLILTITQKVLKNKTFRGIIIGVILIVSLTGICIMVTVSAITSFPSVLFNWGYNPSGTASEGDQITLSEYNSMKTAMSTALDAQHKELTQQIQKDLSDNGYIKQGTTTQTKAVGTPAAFSLAFNPSSKLKLSDVSDQAISDELRQQLLNDITSLTGNKAVVINAIKNGTTKNQMYDDIVKAISGNLRLAEIVTSVFEKDFGKKTSNTIPNEQPESQPDPEPLPAPESAPKPKQVQYVINDSFTGVDDNTINLAICAYSTSKDNDDKATPDEFKTLIEKNTGKYLTYT